MFVHRQTCGYFNIYSNKSQEKTAKKAPFLVTLGIYTVILNQKSFSFFYF